MNASTVSKPIRRVARPRRIVVVDNGSGDGSPTLIRAAHPDITLIDAGGNLGFAKANNLVLRELDADYALLINSDTRVELGTLDRMVEALQADPAIGVVGPRLVNMGDGEDQDYPTQFPTIGEMLRRVIRGPRFPASGQDRPLEVERVHGACMMTRAAVLIGVGLLDEGFFIMTRTRIGASASTVPAGGFNYCRTSACVITAANRLATVQTGSA